MACRSLPLLCRRLQATTNNNYCLMSTRAAEAHKGSTTFDGAPEVLTGSCRIIDGGPEAHKGSTTFDGAPEVLTGSCRIIDGGPEAHTGISRMIEGALPRSLDKFQLSKFPHRWFMPKGYDAPPFILPYKMGRTKGLTFSPKPKSDSDVFIVHDGEDGHHYFSAHSVGEDGTIKPKYYLAAPKTLFDSSCYFTGANCNGVFHFHNPDTRAHYLWNPTKDWLKPLPLSPDKMCGISRSNVVDCAMWRDPNACQDYNVLLVVSDHKDGEDFDAPDKMMQGFDDRSTHHLELYSSRTNSWRKLHCKTRFRSFPPPSYGVCVDGVFYWPVRSVDNIFLMSFDFATGSISTLRLPPGLSRFEKISDYRHHMVEFRGMLGVFVSKVDEIIPSTYQHYVRENGAWRMTWDFTNVGVQRPICFSRNGEVLYFESMNDELVMYNLATKEMKRLGVYCSSRPIELYPAS